jgi:thiol-disulfide isomerase/thioredoxin
MMLPISIQLSKPGRALLLLALFLLGFGNLAGAGVDSFAEAKRLSTDSGKPILFEFYHSDCEYCERSEREAQQNKNVVRALSQVVHYHCNVKEGDGVELSEKYDVGHTYPVFLLTDSTGEPIARWTGFSSGDRLVTNLNTKLRDLTTIAEREILLTTGGSLTDALHLAGYYADATRYVESVSAYRKGAAIIAIRFSIRAPMLPGMK